PGQPCVRPEPPADQCRELVAVRARPPDDVYGDLDEVGLVRLAVDDDRDGAGGDRGVAPTVRGEEDRTAGGAADRCQHAGGGRGAGGGGGVVRRGGGVGGQPPLDQLASEALETRALLSSDVEACGETAVVVREVGHAAGTRAAEPGADGISFEVRADGRKVGE